MFASIFGGLLFGFSFMLVSGTLFGETYNEADDGDPLAPQPSEEEINSFLHENEKRSNWANFKGSWGKRANWKSFQGSWGKRDTEAPFDTFAVLLQDPASSIGTSVSDVEPLGAIPLKKSWQRFTGAWGKRYLEPKTISPRSTNWSSLRGSWGKRSGDWSKLRGMWGKRDPNWNRFRGSWGKRFSDFAGSTKGLEETTSQ